MSFDFELIDIIRFGIGYGPTIIFILIILIGIIKGYVRGLKRTSIYLIHSVICASICLILFFVLVNVKEVDTFILNTTNSFLGSTSIQEMMDVSTDNNSFREIFIEYIPKQMKFFDALSLILSDNGAHLSTLVDVAYRLVFGIALMILYIVLRLFLYVGYNAFKCGKRYDRKRDDLYQLGLVDTPSTKKRALGATLGGSIALFKGILLLSFFGTFFFIFAGGIGERSKDDVVLENENYNLIYGAYSEIGTYGSQGIYKILNSLRDEKDVPYYLFAANLLFKGNLDDSVRGIKDNVYLTDEVAAYVDFSRNTLALFIKYDKNNIVELVNSNFSIDPMDEIIKVFQMEGFQKEFKELIVEFDSKTYFINLTLALVDSMSNNLDKLGLPEEMVNDKLVPLRIMFEEGYLCPDIPSEKEMIDNNENKVLGYLKPSTLIDRNDFYNIYDIFIAVIDNYYNITNNIEYAVTDIIKKTYEKISDLSILSSDRKSEVDPVLKRLYKYLEYKYLGGVSEDILDDIDETNLNISWTEELRSLIDYIVCGLNIYNSAIDKAKENGLEEASAIDYVKETFDVSHKDDLDNLIVSLSASKLLGEVLSASKFLDGLKEIIMSISSDADFPYGISIGDRFDSNGNFKSYGELHYLLKSISLLSDNEIAKDAFLNILFSGEEATDSSQTIIGLLDGLVGDSGSIEMVENLISSKLFSSIISNRIISFASNSKYGIIIDDSIKLRGKNDEILKIIDNNELLKFFKSSEFIKYIINSMQDENYDSKNLVDDVLFGTDYLLDELLESKIIEGTLSNYLFNKYEIENIIIPNELKDNPDVLISKDNEESEIKKLNKASKLNGISALFNNESSENDKVDFITSLDDASANIIFDSDILYYSISDYISTHGLNDDFSLIIPYVSMVDNSNDIILIKRSEVKELIIKLTDIVPKRDLEGNIDGDSLITNLLLNQDVLDNIIINASFANYIINNYSSESSENSLGIIISNNYKELTETGNDLDYNKKCPWYSEIKLLTNGLYTMLYMDGEIHLNNVTETIIEGIKDYNYKENINDITKLDKVYSSNILADSISNILDDKFNVLDSDGNVIVLEEVRDKAKINNIRYKKVEIAGIINLINLYDIDINNLDEDTITRIREDVVDDFDKLLDTDWDNYGYKDNIKLYLYNDYKNSNESKLDYLFYSSIVKDMFTKTIKSNLGIDDNEMILITDSDEFILKDDVIALIKLFKIYDMDLNNTTMPLSNIDDFKPIRDNKNELFNSNIGSIILYSLINGYFNIPEKAKLIYRNDRYNALTDTEIDAILLIIADDDNRFGVSFDGDFNKDNNLSIEDFNDQELEILGNSYIASSYLYDKYSTENEITIYDTEHDKNNIYYIKLNELQALLNFMHKYGDIADLKDKSFNLNPEGNDIDIDDCLESKTISAILFDIIIDALDQKERNYVNTINKQQEVKAVVNIMEELEINSFDGFNDYFNAGGVPQIIKIRDNLDLIYESVIISSNVSTILLDSGLYSDEFYTSSDVYDLSKCRIKKTEMYTLTNYVRIEVKLNKALEYNLKSSVIRYWITENLTSSEITYFNESKDYVRGVLTVSAIERYIEEVA